MPEERERGVDIGQFVNGGNSTRSNSSIVPIGSDPIKFLREEIAEKRNELTQIQNKCRTEERARTEEEKRTFDKLISEIDVYQMELDKFEKQEARTIKSEIESQKAGTTSAEKFTTRSGTFNVYSSRNLKEDRSSEEVNLGQWLRLIATKTPRNEAEERALSISTDSAGGYLAPDQLGTQFLYGLMNYSSVVEAGANVVDLDGPGKSFAFARQTTIPTVGWYGENATIADSDPAFDQTAFEPKKGAFKFKVSNETLQDAINAEQTLKEICLRAAAQGIDAVALAGTGASNQPTGILNVSGINEVDFSASAPTNFDKLIDGRYEIVSDKGDEPTSIIMHPRTYKDYMKLKGTDNQPLMIPKVLENLRWLESQALSIAEGTGTDESSAIMGDFKNLWIGMRLRPTVFIDPYSGSSEDQVLFRMTFRMDVKTTRADHFCKLYGITTP